MGLGAVVGLARRRPAAAPVAPMASPLHTFGLLRVGDLLARDTECSPAERAAFAELAPPPGATIELRGVVAFDAHPDAVLGGHGVRPRRYWLPAMGGELALVVGRNLGTR